MRRFALALALTGAAAFPHLALAQDVQQHVHRHGGMVMPFDLAATVHVFRMTENGGVQRVVTRTQPGDMHQVHMIRQHLQDEAKRFQRGDFADPAALHGSSMPGLAELAAGASRMRVTYRELPDGAEIVFATRDLHLVTAIHRWFGAQLSEHGADARAE